MRTGMWALALVGTLAGAAIAQDTYTARYSYPQGKRLIYEMKTSAALRSTGAKLSQEWKTSEVGEAQGDGSTRVSVDITEVFESEPVSGTIYQREILSRVAEDTVRFTLTGVGEVSDFSVPGLDRLPFRYRQELSLVLLQFQDYYNAGFPALPTGEIQKKGGWEATKEVVVSAPPIDLKNVYTSTFKVKKTKKEDGFQCLEVEEKTKIDLKGYMTFGQGKESKLLTFRTIGSGEREGKFLLDIDRGIILKYESDTDYELKFGMVGGPEGQMAESDASVKIERELDDIKDL